jgi:hypothetical protein
LLSSYPSYALLLQSPFLFLRFSRLTRLFSSSSSYAHCKSPSYTLIYSSIPTLPSNSFCGPMVRIPPFQDTQCPARQVEVRVRFTAVAFRRIVLLSSALSSLSCIRLLLRRGHWDHPYSAGGKEWRLPKKFHFVRFTSFIDMQRSIYILIGIKIVFRSLERAGWSSHKFPVEPKWRAAHPPTDFSDLPSRLLLHFLSLFMESRKRGDHIDIDRARANITSLRGSVGQSVGLIFTVSAVLEILDHDGFGT